MAWSEERRRQHGERMRRYFADPAVRAKMSAANKRALADPAVRAKMSAAKKRAWADPAVRAKMSAAKKRAWADPAVFKKLRPIKTRRPCMSCRNPFWSDGPHHRLCVSCRSGTGLPDYAVPL